MKPKVIILGAGGHTRSIIDALLGQDTYECAGLIIEDQREYKSYQGVEVIGNDDDLPRLRKEVDFAFIGVGSHVGLRMKLAKKLKNLGFDFATIIDPSAIIAADAEISEGVFVGKRAIINSSSKVGKHCIVNTGAIVEHDCLLEDFVHLAPGSILGGDVHLKEGVHLGMGSIVNEGHEIGKGTFIGSGSVVTKDMKEGILAYGSPCKEVR